ncbi:MAG: type II toxin-antitoxin system HicA family toxin [Anaerovoracaceae bacterium]
MKDKDLLKLLRSNGWELKRIQGSHHIMQKDEEIEVIPIHGKDVPTGLLNKILKRTGLR